MKRVSSKKRVFSNADYNSSDGMITTVWGPPLWHFLHTTSFNYPLFPTQADKKNYKNLILGLKCVLPCGNCKRNFSNNLKVLPLKASDMKDRKSFSLWVYKLHEVVNKSLGKKSGLTYADVRERYEHFRARCVVPNTRERKDNTIESPVHGKKAQCILRIIPYNKKNKSLIIDKNCIKGKQKRS